MGLFAHPSARPRHSAGALVVRGLRRRFPFYTSIQGKLQLLGNGNILVSDPEGGRAFEISPAHGNQVVWEYVNKLEGKGDGVLGRVTEARRVDVDGSEFLNKPCPVPEA